MPLSGGTSGAHDDAMHQGSAKRDVANGVAALNGGGYLLCPGRALVLTRSAANQIQFHERTSSEIAFYIERLGINDYTLHIPEGGVNKRIQTESMKDAVSGIAALDAAGSLLVPGSKMYYTRDGSDDVHIYERTSNEEAYAFHRVGADDYTFFVKESNVWKRMQTESMKDAANGIAGLDGSAKVPDANLEIPVTGHGAAQHTDITRKIFIPCNEANVSAGTSTRVGYHPVIQGGANVDAPILYLEMIVPVDFVSFTSMKLLWSSPAASGNMRWDMKAYYAAPGEIYNTHNDGPATGETATAGVNLLNLQESANALTLAGLAVGDFIGIRVARWGSEAGDTLEDVADLYGLVFEYTANQ